MFTVSDVFLATCCH